MNRARGALLIAATALAAAACASPDGQHEPPATPGADLTIPPIVHKDPGPPLPFLDCVNEARTIATDAQRRLFEERRALIGEVMPEDDEIATLAFEFGMAELERDAARFEYLVANDPGRIVVDGGPEVFLTPSWTDADSAALGGSDEAYAQLEQRVDEMRERYENDRDRPVLAEHFRIKILNSHANALIEQRREQATADLAWVLDRCEPLTP